MEEQNFRIKGMSCGHCTAAVEKAAKGIAGVSEAQVDLQTGKLTIKYDGQQDTIDKVIQAVEEIGFEISAA